jgi:hypothetical protein
MEDPKMWRVNHDVGQAVFVRLQGDVLSAQLRLKALLEVSDSQTAALTESGYVEKVIEELEALGMAQQKLYALKSVQPHQNMPRGARTPHDRGPADDAVVGRKNAVIGRPNNEELSAAQMEQKLVEQFRRKNQLYANSGTAPKKKEASKKDSKKK